jgi:hypothetical protein
VEAAYSNQGSIAIDDLGDGDITINLAASVTDDLDDGHYDYDIQLITATTVKTMTIGECVVTADVTRAVS